MSTSRRRVIDALNHRQPDKVPLDLGATPVTGMHVSSVYQLRQALGLDAPGIPVKVVEPYQMLGEIAPDLRAALGVDTVKLAGKGTLFGFTLENWREWRLFDGTPVLVPAGFNTTPEANGDILMYPQGDKSAPPSGRMPCGGYYFDAILRQPPLDEDRLDPADNLEEFEPLSDAEMSHFKAEAQRLYNETDAALVYCFSGASFGDIALVPAPWLKHPCGIRDIEEWYVSTLTRRDYVCAVFERQCEIALDNLARAHEVLGAMPAVIMVTGADFGAQHAPFISSRMYRDLYQPFHRRINDWLHRHTAWKSFIHSCGAVRPLIPDFIAAGFDILNPVQCSAADMDAAALKADFGDALTFWGGGVDTQKTLPFGTPAQVREEVKRRLDVFAPGGGFVFNPIHNVQAKTPVANLLAMYETCNQYR